MAKLILLLLIGGSLALFAASNLTPISLVVLGLRTQALPLAIWILGALLAGGFTTVLLSGFSSISKGAAVRRANQNPRESRSPWTAARSESTPSGSSTGTAGFTAGRPADRAADRATDRATDRSGRSTDRPADRPADRRAANDDWDRDPEAWDNWDEPAPGSTPRADRTDRTDRTRSTENQPGWGDYENRVRSSNRRDPSASAGSRADSRADSWTNSRTDRTSGRNADRSQSETRKSETRKSETRKGDVYDAEYRVLIPPYSAPANPVPPPAPTPPPSNEEDWGLDDDPQDRSR